MNNPPKSLLYPDRRFPNIQHFFMAEFETNRRTNGFVYPCDFLNTLLASIFPEFYNL